MTKLAMGGVFLFAAGVFLIREGRAQIEPSLQDFTCGQVSLFTQCQGGLAACGAIGASCSWCAANPSGTVTDCISQENSSCAVKASGSVSCGRRFDGTCIDDGSGGTVCQGTQTGACPNSAQNNC